MERIIPRVTRLTCKQCGHKWIPRTEDPKICPRCMSRDWNRSGRPRKPTDYRLPPEPNPFDKMRKKLAQGE